MSKQFMLLISALTLSACAAVGSQAVHPLTPSASEIEEFRAREVELWQAWNARLVPADVRRFYSQNPDTIHFDFSPMKFKGWDEYERVATQAIGNSARAETKINDDFTLIKNGDRAVTAFTFHVDFYSNDGIRRNGLNARETDVWVQENGRWVIAHQHMSLPSSPGQDPAGK